MSRHILAKTDLFFFACGETDPLPKKRSTFFFADGEKRCGTQKTWRSRTTPTAREKNGIYGENVHQRNILPSILRPDAHILSLIHI